VKEHVMSAAVITIFDEALKVDEVPLTKPFVPEDEGIGFVVRVGGVMPGDKVAIFGIGGLGHLAQQYAQILGGETIAVDVSNEKLELARQLGAAHVINPATTDPVAAIEELGGADVAIVPASDPKMVEQANASLRRGGLLILVSLPTDTTMALPVFQTVLNGIRVVGSIVGTRPAACLPTASRSVPLS
jgi:alcohol dehydrogenase, propanol-preferring